MPTECVWVGEMPERPWTPGECFWSYEFELSKHYEEHVRAVRRPIAVVLPSRDGHATWFCIDSHPTGKSDEAWGIEIVGDLVVGERPDITVTPSIDCVGLYHGYLQHGVLTDDMPPPPEPEDD